MTQR